MSDSKNEKESIPLSDGDRAKLAELGAYVTSRVEELDSFGRLYESAKAINLAVRGGNVSITVEGLQLGAVETHERDGDYSCWIDPPGVCEPGPCPGVPVPLP